MAKKLFLGVDGGGTKTTAVVFDGDGKFVAKSVGESINYYSNGLYTARANMKKIIDDLALKTGTAIYEAAVIGMSALNDRATDEELSAFADGIIEADAILMDSDLYIALEALCCEGECGVVVSGTGSMVVRRKDNGEIRHSGGWGHILGDEGSGYCIGLEGIKSAIRAVEGYGEKTDLTNEVLSFFKIDNIYNLIDIFYTQGVPRQKIAAFAINVRIAAQHGDKVAYDILKTQAAELAKTAYSQFRKLADGAKIGLWGGMFENCELYRYMFDAALTENKALDVKLLDFTPEVGAIISAYKLKSNVINDSVLENLKNTYGYGAF